MNRRRFIKAGCLLCSGAGFLASVLESCAPAKYASGKLNGDGLLLDISEFKTKQGYRPYVVIRHDDLQFPVCVYRIDDHTYSAVWMQCSHQGAELQVSGDQLTCPAHGSGFDKWGRVQQAPAAKDLRTFPVSISGEQLFIDLRKQSS